MLATKKRKNDTENEHTNTGKRREEQKEWMQMLL